MSRTLHVVPAFRDEVLAFIRSRHRHHGRPPGYQFPRVEAMLRDYGPESLR